jgi:CHAT domain
VLERRYLALAAVSAVLAVAIAIGVWRLRLRRKIRRVVIKFDKGKAVEAKVGGLPEPPRRRKSWTRDDDRDLGSTAAGGGGPVSLGARKNSGLGRARRQRGRPPSPGRYANVVLTNDTYNRSSFLDLDRPLAPESIVKVVISIGRLDPRSAVVDSQRFPDELFATDAWLRVLVTSTDFAVTGDAGGWTGWTSRRHAAVEKPFLLPADGSPARTADGLSFLEFWLAASDEVGEARARISYYFRDALVQSQLLVASVGGETGSVVVRTDYTASALLDDLGAIPDVPRVSLLVNDGPGDSHTLVLRPPTSTTPPDGTRAVPFRLSDSDVRSILVKLRSELTFRVSGTYQRSKDDLIKDLRALAPIGRALHQLLVAHGGRDVVAELYGPPPRPILHIGRPAGVHFNPPWNYVYDIVLRDEIPVKKLPVCPLVEDWDEQSPLVPEPADVCPRAADVDHRKSLLCPFGFWGVSQTLEAPASSRDTNTAIEMRPGAVIPVGETQEVDADALSKHLATLKGVFEARFGQVMLKRGRSRHEIEALLAPDQPLVYFYCHGHKERPNSPDTWLGVGRKEFIKAGDFTDWVTQRLPVKIWDKVRPLVVINACHSLDVLPETFLSYVDAFVGSGTAVGVIGTEVKVPQTLAMRWAETFFEALTRQDGRADKALQAANFHFLAAGNLFGLVYTAHCWAHLSLVAAA